MKKTLFLVSMLFLSIGAYSQVLIDEDFSTATGTVPPTGWTSLDHVASGEVWEFADPTFYANSPISGIAALFDSDGYGTGPAENASIVSPAFDASGAGGYVLTFDHFFESWGTSNYNVEVFDGTTWTSVLSGGSTSTSDPQSETINITAAANGSAVAQVRFTYIGNYGYYWVVDNVKIEQVTCVQPSSVLFTSINGNSATANWTVGATETDWNIQYGLAGFTLGSGTTDVASGTPTYTLNSLTPLTNYEFYVQADCGSGDLSSWVGPFTFNTTCVAPAISTFPWLEDFESATLYEVPCGWGMEDMNGDGIEWIVYDYVANSGSNALYMEFDYYYYDDMNDWTYTPELVLEMDSTYQLLFSYATGGYDENLEVFIGTGQTSTAMTTQLVDLPGISNEDFITQVITFTVPADGSYFIGFHGYSDADMYYIAVDDVNVIYAPACPDITNLTLENSGSDFADISWTSGNTETTWNIEYGAPGFTLGSGTSGVAITLPEYTVSGLNPLSTYEIYVQSDCGGEQGTWVGPFTFNTTCVAPVISTFPWTEGFESTTLNELPCGWSLDNVNGDSEVWFVDDYNPNSGNNALYIQFNSNLDMNDWAFTPEFVLQAGVNYQFTFAYRNSGTTFPEKLAFHLGQSASVAGMTTELVDLPSITNSSYLTEVISFTVPTDGSYYFGFHGYSDADEYYMVVDDLFLEIVVNCDEVTNIILDAVTDQTADISWTAGGTETAWNIEYGATGFTIGSGTSDVVNTTPTYTVPGLTAQTQYDFYVQADCGLETSSWVGPFTFTTSCAPLVGAAAFTFASDTLCTDGNPVTPVVTGTTGGEFTGTFGLDVNPVTGAVNPVNSPEGNHFLYYTVTIGACEYTDSVAITVIDCETSGIDQLTIDGVSVYPNPSNGIVIVDLTSKLDAVITLIDYTGKEVSFLTNQNSEMQYQLDLSTLVDGIYFVKISVDDKQMVEKIILKK